MRWSAGMLALAAGTAIAVAGTTIALAGTVLSGAHGGPEAAAATASVATASAGVVAPGLGVAAPGLAVAAPGPAPEPLQGIENVAYDGRFALARIRFGAGLGGGFGMGGRTPPWAHDYPRAERNLMRIAREVSYIRPSVYGGNVFDLDDPELMRFPVAYLVEPGYWYPEGTEVERLREYLLKGGFLIVDDFRGRDWINFEAQMRRVLPDLAFVELDVEDPVFQTYLAMDQLDFPHPYDRWTDPTYLGIHEDNDPTRRLMVVVNFDQDIGDYWEYADLGRYAVDPSNEAFKLGLNYLIYGMTH